MGHQYRRAHLRSGIEAGRTGIAIVNVDEGPGWALLFSPNAFVRWLVQGAESNVTQNTFLETGPASAQAVWCGQQGTHIIAQDIFTVLDVSVAANQATGEAITGLVGNTQRPGAGARFFPSMIFRGELNHEGQMVEHFFPQWGPVALSISSTMTIEGTIAAAGVGPPAPVNRILGWPPGDRGQLQVRSVLPLTASIFSGDPGKVPVLRWISGAPSTVFTLDVSPLEHVVLTNANPLIVAFSATWRNVGATRQV